MEYIQQRTNKQYTILVVRSCPYRMLATNDCFRAQVTHEALGNIRGQNMDAVLKVNIPKFFTKNTIDYSQYYNTQHPLLP